VLRWNTGADPREGPEKRRTRGFANKLRMMNTRRGDPGKKTGAKVKKGDKGHCEGQPKGRGTKNGVEGFLPVEYGMGDITRFTIRSAKETKRNWKI